MVCKVPRVNVMPRDRAESSERLARKSIDHAEGIVDHDHSELESNVVVGA